ncbi:MarR family winged helix-turn-helix transcriptional regulator [Nocardia sp. NBC_00511]|uniref:MarR family winged helix-turn-helix transcriptional regulator n=1 Tax=Nocardia sp. NBC_00511 TaxID=2903591 RepID=UPI0030E1A68F
MFDGQISDSKAQLEAQVANELAALQAAHDDSDRALADYLGIGRNDLRCLDVIMREGPRSAGYLATRLHLTPGSVTALLGRLEAKDYATRRPDPSHGKRILVHPTARIVELITPVLAARIVRGRERLAAYSEPELILIRDFLDRTRSSHEQFAVEIRAALGPR